MAHTIFCLSSGVGLKKCFFRSGHILDYSYKQQTSQDCMNHAVLSKQTSQEDVMIKITKKGWKSLCDKWRQEDSSMNLRPCFRRLAESKNSMPRNIHSRSAFDECFRLSLNSNQAHSMADDCSLMRSCQPVMLTGLNE